MAFSKFKLHTKLVLILQLLLIVVGALGFMCFEASNPLTIANYSFGDKLLVSTFQSVSARTAGFMTVDLSSINPITKIIIINELTKKENVDENLKQINQLEWVRCMNNIKNRSEEIVLHELIYC